MLYANIRSTHIIHIVYNISNLMYFFIIALYYEKERNKYKNKYFLKIIQKSQFFGKSVDIPFVYFISNQIYFAIVLNSHAI